MNLKSAPRLGVPLETTEDEPAKSNVHAFPTCHVVHIFRLHEGGWQEMKKD